MSGALFLLSCCVLCWWSWITPVQCECPWEETNLLSWSESATWGTAGVPADNSKVTIPSGKRVLLDVQPAKLTWLTIEAGAALIWGNVDGLTLDTHYIWVKGEFHMGSKSCTFPKTANIRLHGHSQDDYEVKDHEFGRKFIGAAPGGTLEIHGTFKTSWTKLAQTIRPITDVACAMIYDHSNYTQNKALTDKSLGLNVMVWNADGSFMDYGYFKDYQDLATFVQDLFDDKVVAMFAYGNNGIFTKTQVLVDTVVGLGGSLINDAQDNYGYVFIGKKGSKSSVKEIIRSDNSVDGDEVDFLSFHDKEEDLIFQVAVNPGTVKALQMFRVLNAKAAYPKLTLADEVKGWKIGNEVIVTSTDFDWKQAEVRTIVDCNDCSPRQIRVNETFHHIHFGNFTNYVDERAEVAMLSRSIVIEGVMESTCIERTDEEKETGLCEKFDRDTFGGHLMVVRGFNSTHVRGAKLLHMGQQKHRGAYPLHFHMVDSARGAYLKQNTIQDSFSRCVAVHGTDWLQVLDNVCYKHLGHGLFLEDSVEQENKVRGNLIVGTSHGTLLLSDRKKDWCTNAYRVYCSTLSSFWLTHPNNEVSGNVAAGGEGIGYMYVFADRPLGPSLQRQQELNRHHNPKSFPLRFTRNVAHSNQEAGVHMDEKISTGTGMENKGNITENGILRTENEYDPHIGEKPVWTEMSYGTYYKNKIRNLWIKGGNVRVSYSTIADAKEGFSGGTTLFDTGTEVYKCIFIGESDNTGEPRDWNVDGYMMSFDRSYGGSPEFTLTAISLYQGPNFVNSAFFDRYNTVSWCAEDGKTVSQCRNDKVITRHAGAISFKRSNTYPTMTSTYAVNNTFGFCDNVNGQHWVYQGANSLSDWEWKDGNKAVFVRDKDGHLTGTVNASIVPNFPLHSGHECQEREDWGDMLVCPYRYIKMEVLGKGGSLDSNKKDKYPLIMERDDYPFNVSFQHMGEIRNEWLLRINRSYVLNLNKSLSGAAHPDEIKIMGYGVEKGDVVRVGICQPKDVEEFEILMYYPLFIKNNATWVNSLDDLDSDTTGAAFFYDKSIGILFFKIIGFEVDTNETQQCPGGKCWKVVIRLNGGSRDTINTCRSRNIPSYQGELGIAKKPTTPPCPGIATPEGLGSVDWNNLGFVEHNEYSVPCKPFVTPTGRSTPTSLGCFEEKDGSDWQEMKTEQMVFLMKSMTVDYCVHRCYYRGYKYAGLSRSSRCTCGNTLNDSSPFQASNSACSKDCRGDSSQKCGGTTELSVWTTGIAL